MFDSDSDSDSNSKQKWNHPGIDSDSNSGIMHHWSELTRMQVDTSIEYYKVYGPSIIVCFYRDTIYTSMPIIITL